MKAMGKLFLIIISFLVLVIVVLVVFQKPKEEYQKKIPDLIKECVLLDEKGEYELAVEKCKEAIVLSGEADLSPNHPYIAESLNNLGALYTKLELYDKAESSLLHTLEIYKWAINQKAISQDHPYIAITLNNLANLYKKQALYVKAEPLYKKVIEILEKTPNPNFLIYVKSLNNLGELYRDKSLYAQAEQLYARALDLSEKTLDRNDSAVALSLNNLGLLYYDQMLYAKAEPLYLRSLKIKETAIDSNPIDVAKTLGNLGLLYKTQGLYAKAEFFYKRALAIKQKMLDPNHSDIATQLSNIAVLYHEQNLYAKAEPLYLRSLTIREKALGADHPDVALTLNNLASLYQDKGFYAKAEPLYKRTLIIREKVFGTNHPDVALSLNNLGTLYHVQGLYVEAESFYKHASKIYENNLLSNHISIVPVLSNLGILYFNLYQFELARILMQKALPIIENHIRDTFAILTEQQRISFVKGSRYYFDWYLSLFDRKGDEKEAYNHSMNWKGVVLNSMKAQKAFLDERAEKDPEFREKLNDYEDMLRYQSKLTTKQNLNENEKKELESATNKREELEKYFASIDESYQNEKEFQNIKVENICSVLKQDEVIVDYLKYTKSVLKKGDKKNDVDYIDSYLAFILIGGENCKTPKRIELGEAGEIEETVTSYRSLFAKEISINQATDPKRYSQKLMRKIWKPVEEFFGGRTKIWIIPDGALGGVSFQTLQTNTDGYLLDTYDIRYLDTGSDLYRASVIKREKSTKTALLAGNIDVNIAKVEEKETETAFSQFKGGDSCRLDNFDDLRIDKETGKRIEDETGTIKKLLKNMDIKVYEADKASKSTVFEAMKTNPGIIHISTHGFYQSDECVNKPPQKLDEQNNILKTFEENKKVESDPMSRSGVVFAGVNNPEYHDQAIATGIDFSGLNLRKTDLFVLSACQSGMGGLSQGEGVVGMRRALSMAGVGTVISTLWDAWDETTKPIMEEFYAGYLKTGKAHETMRKIQIKYRNQYPDRYRLWGFLVVSGATE